MQQEISRLTLGWVWRSLKVLAYSIGGAVAVAVVGGVLYLGSRADLERWHLVDLDQVFTAEMRLASFEAYLRLEERLFRQLDA